MKEKKSSHPWVTEECREAVKKKNEAEQILGEQRREHPGTSHGDSEAQLEQLILDGNEALGSAYEEYVRRVREEIKTLPRSSKKWWQLNRVLLGRPARQASSIPPLKKSSGEWSLNGKDKADRLATTFDDKSKLPKKEIEWRPTESPEQMASFCMLRVGGY